MAYADRHLLVTFNGTPYKYYPGKANPKLARECRAVFGMGPADLWATWFGTRFFEADQAASLLWICRKQMADMLGMPDFAMSLDQLDELVTSDAVGEGFTIEMIDFTEKADTPPPIEEVTAVDDEGLLEVAPDPEG